MSSLSFLALAAAPSAVSAFVSQRPFAARASPAFSYLSSLGGDELGNTPQNSDGPNATPRDFFAMRAEDDRTVRGYK
jgi:hypothetical protein